MNSTMGHLFGGYNNKPFHQKKRVALSKEEVLNARGMYEPIFDAKTRTRRTIFRQPATDLTEHLKSGGIQNR